MKRLRWFSFLVLAGLQGIFAASGSCADAARAATSPEKSVRIAVVIGNGSYRSGALANPRNDATAMATSLKKLGFDVELMLDATKADMDAVFRRLSAKTDKAGVAALFYAGHGIQVNGSNYIVPIDANPKNERDLKRDMVKMDDVIDDMGDARVKLVFFDACRDNPLARSFSRGGSRGMAAPVEATGTLISFATKHGNTAADGVGTHSPYTTALLAALENPSGVEIEQMLRKVQQGVKQATDGQQEPWRYGSLDGDFYFREADVSAVAAKVQQEVVNKAVSEAMKRANEQAAREKAELQQSIKALQEASERAIAEAVKVQKQASESAVADAIKRSNEQAARERAELQQSMDKLLREALARQNAAIEAERLALQAARGEAGKVQASPPAGAVPAVVQPQPIQVAAIAATGTGGSAKPSEKALATVTSGSGDEWAYTAKDIYGKEQKLIARVKAVVPGAGVLEEFVVDGRPSAEWVFDGRPSLVGIPTDSVMMLSPNWTSEDISKLFILNPSRCRQIQYVNGCEISKKTLAGTETITVPAGKFETKKLEIVVRFATDYGDATLEVIAWYSTQHKRLIRQKIKGFHPMAEAPVNALIETMELSSFRSLVR